MLSFLLDPHIALFLLLLFTNRAASTPQAAPGSSTPYLRIEGPTTTIFEGPITSGPRNLTAVVSDAGYNHPCNGGYLHNTDPGAFNTAIDAVDAASKLSPGFDISYGYDGDLSNFYIFKLGRLEEESWGLLYNWQIPCNGGGPFSFCGCNQKAQTNSRVLWTYNTTEQSVFLRVHPNPVTVKKGGSVTFQIVDGLTGAIQPDATIHGVKADSKGTVTVKYPTAGVFTFKAEEEGAVRSELITITVTD